MKEERGNRLVGDAKREGSGRKGGDRVLGNKGRRDYEKNAEIQQLGMKYQGRTNLLQNREKADRERKGIVQ